MSIIRELEEQGTDVANSVSLELRLHLESLVACVKPVHQPRSAGYWPVEACEDGIEGVVAIAGLRTLHCLA